MAYQSFEDLDVWLLPRRFAADICRTLNGCRDYNFRNQITDAWCSISNNIAEGSERLHRAEFIQFLGYANGSVGEACNKLYLAEDLGLVAPAPAAQLRADARLISGKIYALIRSSGDAS